MRLDAPTRGTIIKVLVDEGDNVDADPPLTDTKAMKTERAIVAPYSGVVCTIPFAVGQLVSGGTTFIERNATYGS